MTSRESPPRGRTQLIRSGLAPLELILCLPMLLMMMAMIIIAGTAGVWKVRTAVNSHEAALRTVWPRDSRELVPAHWRMGVMSVDDPSRPSPPHFFDDPLLDHVVVRGPYVMQLRVDADLFDMTRGVHSGFAEINRPFPLWPQLPYRNHYMRDTPVLTGPAWQHDTFGIEHSDRRIPILYPDFSIPR